MTALNSIINAIGRINELTGKAVSWLTLALVFFVSADVAMRYLFNISFVALQELEWHIYSIIFLLGAGYTLKQNGHVRVDLIYQRLGKRHRAYIDVLGCLLFLFPGCFLVIKTAIPFVYTSYRMHEGSPDPGGLAARYLLKSTMIIGFLLLWIQGAAMLLDRLLYLFGRDGSQGKG